MVMAIIARKIANSKMLVIISILFLVNKYCGKGWIRTSLEVVAFNFEIEK